MGANASQPKPAQQADCSASGSPRRPIGNTNKNCRTAQTFCPRAREIEGPEAFPGPSAHLFPRRFVRVSASCRACRSSFRLFSLLSGGAALAFFFAGDFFAADFLARFTGAFFAAAGSSATGGGCGAAATPGRSEMTNSSSPSSSRISSGSPRSSSSSSKCTNSLSSPCSSFLSCLGSSRFSLRSVALSADAMAVAATAGI